MKRLKKIVSVLLIVCMLFAMTASAFATELTDLQKELKQIEKESKSASTTLASVNTKINTIQARVTSLTTQISSTTKSIESLEKKIAKKQEQMDERENDLNKRLVVMYKNGSVGFVDVLLGSNSISEFVSNMGMVKRIYQNDIETLQKLTQKHDDLAEDLAELQEKKASLANQQTELYTQKTLLAAEKKILSDKIDALNAEADRMTLEIVKLIDANSEYVGGALTWPCPSSHYVASAFGNRLHPILKVWKKHTGIDIPAVTGAKIEAAAPGRVILAESYGNYGLCVAIDHGGGVVTLYAHASKLKVKKGDIVARGDTVALVGMTGMATGPHLHFEVRINGECVDPMKHLVTK